MQDASHPRPLAQAVENVYTNGYSAVQEKKYTHDHEWIELDADGKIGMPCHLFHIMPTTTFSESSILTISSLLLSKQAR